MEVSRIPDHLLSSLLAPQKGGEASGPALSSLKSEDLFTVMMAVYLSHIHQLVKSSWENFAETRQAIAERGADNHEDHTRERVIEKILLHEGQRRHHREHSPESALNVGRHLHFPI